MAQWSACYIASPASLVAFSTLLYDTVNLYHLVVSRTLDLTFTSVQFQRMMVNVRLRRSLKELNVKHFDGWRGGGGKCPTPVSVWGQIIWGHLFLYTIFDMYKIKCPRGHMQIDD